MKKVLYLMTILFSVIIFLFVFEDYSYQNEVNNSVPILTGNNGSLYTFGYSCNLATKEERDQFVDELISFASRNQIEIMGTLTYTNEDMIEVNDYYIYAQKDQEVILRGITFENGHDDLDFTAAHSGFYSNSKIDENAYDYFVYIDRFYRENITKEIRHYYPFADLKDVVNLSNDYSFSIRFYCYDPEQIIEAIKQEPFAKYFDFDLLPYFITSVSDMEVLQIDYTNQFQVIAILAVIALLLTVLEVTYKKRHSIGIHKLLGISNLRIARKVFLSLFIKTILLYLLIQLIMFYIFCGIIHPDSILMIKALAMYFIVVFFLLIVIGGISYFILCKVPITYSLKARQNKASSFHTTFFIMKLCLILFAANGFLSILYDVQASGTTWWIYTQRKDEMSQYYQLYDSLLSIPAQFDTNLIYEIGESHGALLAEFIVPTIAPGETYDSEYLRRVVIKANNNYLDLYTMLDETGNPIDPKLYDGDVCFLPIAALDYIDPSLPQERVYYYNHIRFYSYAYPAMSIYEDDPIIYRKSNLYDVNVSAITYVIPKATYSSYIEELEENGLGDIISYVDVESILSVNLAGMRTYFLQNAAVMLVYLFCLYCMIRQSLMIYLYEYGHKLSIRYIHGWSFMKRYWEIIFINIFGYLFILLSLIFIVKITVMEAILYTMALLAYDFIIVILTILRTQKRMLKANLKGGKWE